jgi:xanthine dehydrogenase molybdopterin-binding subunit B
MHVYKTKLGEACFIDDMPAMKGEFHAAPILASVQPGTKLEIDTSESAIKVVIFWYKNFHANF